MNTRALGFVLYPILLVVAFAAPAVAGDFYVSIDTGNNVSNGLTPATAWKNIAYAIANVPFESPTGKHTIHVAAGTYSGPDGETFPLRAETLVGSGAADIEIVSTGGSSVTTLTSNSFAAVVVGSYFDIFLLELRTSRITRVEGFRIEALQFGVRVAAEAANLSPAFVDLVVEGGTGTGFVIESAADSNFGTLGIVNDCLLLDCEVRGFGGNGVEMRASGAIGIASSNTVFLVDTVLSSNGGRGLFLEAVDGSVTAIVQRCRFEGNLGAGCEQADTCCTDGSANLIATSTSFTGNAGGGLIQSNTGTSLASPLANLTRCTIAGNQVGGIQALSGPVVLAADSCVIYSNPVDVSGGFDSLSIEFSDVGTGTTGGSATNISADPLFVDAANGDYRLQDGSPCIDAGDPALSPDPDGTVADMGALPFDQDATTSYCTGKTNSLGCVPFVAWSGFASTSAPQPFTLTAEDLLPGEAGLLVYGYQAGNLNFHGGKLCVKAPLKRALPAKLAKSAGSPPCSGRLTRDFNARIQSGTDAMLTAGQTVYVQWRLRDPQDPAGFGDGLSDAAQFLIAP